MTKKINLALQGGGAHGAFTWGVLDRLLEDDEVEIAGISGTSAGAINGVVMAEGLMEGGRNRARTQLEEFWYEISVAGLSSPIQRSVFDKLRGDFSLDNSPSYIWFDILSRVMSPYQLNPQNTNLLRDVLLRFVDFELVRKCDQLKLFINTTRVTTGTLRVFREYEVTPEIVLASACIPYLFQTVMIDGEGYWDGGFIANPALEPLLSDTETRDILIVQINPLFRDGVPTDARDILNRLNEVSFNSSLLKELRLISKLNDLVDAGELEADKHPKARLHMIHGEHRLLPFEASSKLNPEWPFLSTLRDVGRAAADNWLSKHKASLGVSSTIDYRQLVEGIEREAAAAAHA
ncbi:MAG: patatin-like phospholipase family protein [Geminicoccaceae bacterium]